MHWIWRAAYDVSNVAVVEEIVVVSLGFEM